MSSHYYSRNFVPNYYYHIYNRGAYKHDIYLEISDYRVFIDICAYYIRFPEGKALSRVDLSTRDSSLQVTNLHSKTSSFDLCAYCLMPNHFHLLVKQVRKQSSKDSISNFMRRTMITYSLYTKDKYNRSGALFEARYKNVLVESDSQLLHLTRYIHLNPIAYPEYASYELAEKYEFSSYGAYSGIEIKPKWLETESVMKFFSYNSSRYKSFISEKPVDYGINEKLKIEK